MSLFGTTSTILTLSSGILKKVATSYSGQYIAVITSGTSNSGVFVSNNYGATFTETVVNDLPTGTKDWYTVTVSPNGQYMAVIHWYPAYTNTRIYRSINYGATFNYVGAVMSANPMTIGDNGTILVPSFQTGVNVTVITLTSTSFLELTFLAAANRILADDTFVSQTVATYNGPAQYSINSYNPILGLSSSVYKNAPSVILVTGYYLESFDISADGVVAFGGWLINGTSDHVFCISRDSMNSWEFVMRGYGNVTNAFTNNITLDNAAAGNLGYLRMPTVSSDGKCISINTSLKGLIYSNDQGITWNTIPGLQLSTNSNILFGVMTQAPYLSTSTNALFYFYGSSLYKVPIIPPAAIDTSTVVKTLVSSNGVYTIKSNSPIINPDVFIKFDNSTLTTNKLIAGNSSLATTIITKLDVVDKWLSVSKSNTGVSSSLYSGIFSFYESKASGLMFNRSNTRWRFFRDSGIDITNRPNNFTTYASIEVEATYTLSDRRLKKNIKQLGNYLEIVDDIECVSYKWLRDNGEHPDEIGVIAQQIQQVIPSITRSTDDDILTVDYNKLSVIAIKCIQELKMEVAKLTNRVNNLQIELNLIKSEKQPVMQYEVQELN
jgi:hypothetical protein